MKAIVSVIGVDTVGIIAKVSSALADMKINIIDISQTVLDKYFVMIMMTELNKNSRLREIALSLSKLGEKIGVTINIQHEEIFNTMHKI